ncbi:MFS transporter [Dinghuibacter silviterrae]|uniref:EmrB/QacA subfamily drug resistance transporter n=1 Tax=Dinghuibacter silviterrae TaxID=1539049 RepID=A0A4R8DEF6_9BACT|nr:MFS transporter [Dinghuibacter silviterrae]TDW95815.1 EmrB/QacA subfamily drug resistance transporter [Dinghuibacter silviterrae]
MSTVPLNSPAGRWVMASAILASSMGFIDGTALNVVLPSLQRSLGATGTEIFWILNAYLLMLASLILVGGALGDKLGRKKVFMTGIAAFIVGSAACGCSPGVAYLIAFRAVQGLGGSLMIPGSLSLISSTIDDKEKGKAIGTWSAISTIVTIGGPVLGGALADAGLWRYIFFLNIPIGIAALVILWRKVGENRDEQADPALDIPGALSIAFGLALLTFGCLRLPQAGIRDAWVLATIGAGVLLLGVFVLVEKRSKHPMMPLHLFANRTFAGANLLTFFLYAGLGAGMLFLSLNLVQAQGYDQLQSGLTFLPFTIVMILCSRFAGSLADRHGPRPLLVGGAATAGLGLWLLSLVGETGGPSTYWTTFLPGMLIFGLGMAFTVAPLTTAVMGSVSDQLSGVASGVNNALTRVANVFANAILGSLAVLLFTASIGHRLDNLGLDAGLHRQALAQAVELGNAKVPADAGAMAGAIQKVYRDGFIDVYQRIMRIAATFAWGAALLAFLTIRPRRAEG